MEKNGNAGNWILTDDDSCQICREIKDGVFELFQVTKILPSWKDSEDGKDFRVSHAFIYVDDMNDEDIRNICECYGYDNLDTLKEEYGEEWKQILAECEFELEALECLIKSKDMTYKQAVTMIRELSGYETEPSDPLVRFVKKKGIYRTGGYDFRYIADTGKVLVQMEGCAVVVESAEQYKRYCHDGPKIWERKQLNAEWIPHMKAYRLYNPEDQQQTVAYEDDLNTAEKMAYENGYQKFVLCDADSMHTEHS